MNKENIIASIREEKSFIQDQFGVEEIALFGSYARGDNNANSDVDIFVTMSKPSYSLIMGLYAFLEKKLNANIDITRKGPHISERFINHISKDIIYV